MHLRVWLWLVLVMGSCSSDEASYDEITSASECAACSIRLHPIWESQDGDDNLTAGGWPFESENTLWLVGERLGPSIVRLPTDGRRSDLIHREGDGPGEFRWITAAGSFADGDSLVILEDAAVTYLDSGLRSVRRLHNVLPRSTGWLVLPDGSVLHANTRTSTSGSAVDHTLHLVESTGVRIASFRTAGSHDGLGLWPMGLGMVEGTVWVLEPRVTGFTVELWDVNNRARLRAHSLDPDWWVRKTSPADVGEEAATRHAGSERRPTGTVGVYESQEHLWIALRHPDRNRTDRGISGNLAEVFDGVLLALDKSSGSVLAAKVVDAFPYGFTNRGRLVLYHEGPRGHPSIRLVDVELVR